MEAACTSVSQWKPLVPNAPVRKDTSCWRTGRTVTQKVWASFLLWILRWMSLKVTLYSKIFFLSSPAEFPCGRTALTPSGSAYTRSLLGHENASLENTTSTTSPPSTPAGTTVTLPATSELTTIRSRKKLPRWRLVDAGPTEEPPRALKRIVGGEVVIPGEIPWQVLCRSRGVKSDACKAFGSGSAWGDKTQQVQFVGFLVTAHRSFLPLLFRRPW